MTTCSTCLFVCLRPNVLRLQKKFVQTDRQSAEQRSFACFILVSWHSWSTIQNCLCQYKYPVSGSKESIILVQEHTGMQAVPRLKQRTWICRHAFFPTQLHKPSFLLMLYHVTQTYDQTITFNSVHELACWVWAQMTTWTNLTHLKNVIQRTNDSLSFLFSGYILLFFKRTSSFCQR